MPRATKKQRVLDYAAERGWDAIGEAEWNQMRHDLPQIAVSTIQSSGLKIDPPWSGVAQHTLDELEASLLAMTEVYAARPDLRRFSREQVIEAKDHARWASRSRRVADEKRELKNEMVEWMLVWLDDPEMFPAWAKLRRNALAQ